MGVTHTDIGIGGQGSNSGSSDEVPKSMVWVAPHDENEGPVSRQQEMGVKPGTKYKGLIRARRDEAARVDHLKTQGKWLKVHSGMAQALVKYSWKRIRRMEGVTAYQSQNIMKINYNR